MEATIHLIGCRSYSVNLGGKPFKFVFGRGQTVSDINLIEYCKSQPDRFNVTITSRAQKIQTKPVPKQAVVEEEDDESQEEDDDPQEEDEEEVERVESSSKNEPPKRGRKRVKVE